MFDSLNFSDFCVLTDLDFVLKAEGGWHPSYVLGYYPANKKNRILSFVHNKDCYTETNLTISENKQGLRCFGGRTNTCGRRNLPPKGRDSQTLFIKGVKFDPKGADSWTCPAFSDRNFYSFTGSYYHVYVKMASCPVPKGKTLSLLNLLHMHPS